MIKPATYWAAHKRASTPLQLGRIGFALAGREAELNPPLTDAEALTIELIRQDSEWFDERLDARRERDRVRKAEYRARRQEEKTGCPTMSQGQDGTNGMDECPTPSVPPSVPPSLRPSVTIQDINTDTDTDRGSRGIPARDRGRGRSLNLDVLGMTDEEIFSGTHPTTALIRSLCGDGSWRKAIDQVGEDIVLGDLVAFIHEIKAGEAPRNAGAAFTARLRKLGAFAS